MAYQSTLLAGTTPLSSADLSLPNADNEELIIVDSGLRKITVPKSLSTIGVSMDHNAETVFIQVPRYFDGNDLSLHSPVIRFINAGNEYGEYHVTDSTVNDDNILLAWKIDHYFTRYAGTASFTVQFETLNNYQWQTTPATMIILKGINAEGTITDKDDVLFRTLVAQIENLQDRVSVLESELSRTIEISQQFDSIVKRLTYLENNVVYTVSDV